MEELLPLKPMQVGISIGLVKTPHYQAIQVFKELSETIKEKLPDQKVFISIDTHYLLMFGNAFPLRFGTKADFS